jgi:hypothetical protein
MKRLGIGAVIALLAASAAHADTPSDFVKRHTASGGNVDALMADYADDAVVLQSGRAVQGKAEIRKLFAGMFGGGRAPGAGGPPPGAAPGAPPAGGPPAGGGMGGGMGGMKVTKVWEEGNVGFMTWEMGPMHMTEEFIIKNNKIAVQAIFMTGGGMPAGGMGNMGQGGMPPGGNMGQGGMNHSGAAAPGGADTSHDHK